MAKVVTMGEIMLRLSTPGNQKYIQATQFDINYGGGEANVAVSLANYGVDAAFVSKLPMQTTVTTLNLLQKFLKTQSALAQLRH